MNCSRQFAEELLKSFYACRYTYGSERMEKMNAALEGACFSESVNEDENCPSHKIALPGGYTLLRESNGLRELFEASGIPTQYEMLVFTAFAWSRFFELSGIRRDAKALWEKPDQNTMSCCCDIVMGMLEDYQARPPIVTPPKVVRAVLIADRYCGDANKLRTFLNLRTPVEVSDILPGDADIDFCSPLDIAIFVDTQDNTSNYHIPEKLREHNPYLATMIWGLIDACVLDICRQYNIFFKVDSHKTTYYQFASYLVQIKEHSPSKWANVPCP